MCAGETYNPNGKHASLVIYVRGKTQPGETYHYDSALNCTYELAYLSLLLVAITSYQY